MLFFTFYYILAPAQSIKENAEKNLAVRPDLFGQVLINHNLDNVICHFDEAIHTLCLCFLFNAEPFNQRP